MDNKKLLKVERLLRLSDVKYRTGLSRSKIYQLIKEDKFPRQIQITERCVGWVEDHIQDWLLQRLEASNIQ